MSGWHQAGTGGGLAHSQHGRLSVKWAGKQGPFFRYFRKFAQRHELEAPAVLRVASMRRLEPFQIRSRYRKKVVIPSLKFVSTTGFFQGLDTRPQIQVVCVVEDEANAEGLNLLRSEPLDSCLGRDRHECGKHRDAICLINSEI